MKTQCHHWIWTDLWACFSCIVILLVMMICTSNIICTFRVLFWVLRLTSHKNCVERGDDVNIFLNHALWCSDRPGQLYLMPVFHRWFVSYLVTNMHCRFCYLKVLFMWHCGKCYVINSYFWCVRSNNCVPSSLVNTLCKIQRVPDENFYLWLCFCSSFSLVPTVVLILKKYCFSFSY